MWEYVLGILSGILLPILFYFLQKRKEKKLEEKNELRLEPLIYGNGIFEERDNKLIFGIDNELDSKDLIYCMFPISIGNLGINTINNINVTFNYVRNSPIAINNDSLEFDTLIDKKHIVRKTLQSSENISTNYRIKYIHPKTSAQLKQVHLLNQETNLKFEIPIEKGKMSVNAEVSHTFNIIISAENIEIKTYRFSLRVVKAKNLDDLIEKTISQIKKNKSEENQKLFESNFEGLKTINIENIEKMLSQDFHYFAPRLDNQMKVHNRDNYLCDTSENDYKFVTISPIKVGK